MSHFANHRNAVLAAQAKQDESQRAAEEKEQATESAPAEAGAHLEHLTPMQRHKANMEAQRTPPPAPAPRRTTGRAAAGKAAKEVKSEMLQAIESLHGLDLKDKITLKKKLVKQFRPAAEGLLEARARDDDFSAWIVWLFDIGAIEEFMEKAPAAIALGWLTAPLGMKRSLQEFFFDKMREWSEDQFKAGNSAEPYFSTVYGQHGKMQAVVAAKFHKLAGDMLLAQGDKAEGVNERQGFLKKALETFGFAKKSHDKIGVDTRVNEIQKELKDTEGNGWQPPPTPPAGGGPDAKES